MTADKSPADVCSECGGSGLIAAQECCGRRDRQGECCGEEGWKQAEATAVEFRRVLAEEIDRLSDRNSLLLATCYGLRKQRDEQQDKIDHLRSLMRDTLQLSYGIPGSLRDRLSLALAEDE